MSYRRLAMVVPIAGLIAVLAAAPTVSAKPKPTTTTTTTTVPTTTEPPTTAPTAMPTTETCWSPSSEPVTATSTWTQSETTAPCTYTLYVWSLLPGSVYMVSNEWMIEYRAAAAGDPVAFQYDGQNWTYDSTHSNGPACGDAVSCDGLPLEEDPY